MTKAEMIKEILECGVVFVSESPMHYAKGHSKEDVERLLNWAREFKKTMAEG